MFTLICLKALRLSYILPNSLVMRKMKVNAECSDIDNSVVLPSTGSRGGRGCAPPLKNDKSVVIFVNFFIFN